MSSGDKAQGGDRRDNFRKSNAAEGLKETRKETFLKIAGKGDKKDSFFDAQVALTKRSKLALFFRSVSAD
jgi:hypothetical protein